MADHIANDGLLGAGRYRAGIRATELRMDRGTCVAVGVTDEPWELVRTYYVPFEDGIDLVSPVVARSLAIMQERGRDLTATADEADEEEPRRTGQVARGHGGPGSRGGTRERGSSPHSPREPVSLT